MARARAFYGLLLFLALFATWPAPSLAQSEATRLNENWWAIKTARWRVVGPDDMLVRPNGSIELPDDVREGMKQTASVRIGLRDNLFTPYPMLYANFPVRFVHEGSSIDLGSRRHRLGIHIEVDGEPVVVTEAGKWTNSAVVIDEITIGKRAFAALIEAFRHGSDARVRLIVDGRPRLAYEFTLAGFWGGYVSAMGDWLK